MVQRPDATVLVTTGTCASAEMLRRRPRAAVIHQFAPRHTRRRIRLFASLAARSWGICRERALAQPRYSARAGVGVKLALHLGPNSPRPARTAGRGPGGRPAVLRGFDLLLARADVGIGRRFFRVLGVEPDGVLDLKSGVVPCPWTPPSLRPAQPPWRTGRSFLRRARTPGDEFAARSVPTSTAGETPVRLAGPGPRHPDRGGPVA